VKESDVPRRLSRGYSLTEMVMVVACILILTAAIVPVTRLGVQREREMELREDLRVMRSAIDEYKRYSDQGLIPIDVDTEGYPKSLEVLVQGVDLVGQLKKKHRFLRKIPVDPMTQKGEWGVRSYQDEPDSTSWGRQNVYDVYSLSDGSALNKTKYKDW
jgi:general secretion pathway protein G